MRPTLPVSLLLVATLAACSPASNDAQVAALKAEVAQL